MSDFETVAGSIDESLRFADAPKEPSIYACNHSLEEYAPKHRITFGANDKYYWCQKCGLQLLGKQIDDYCNEKTELFKKHKEETLNAYGEKNKLWHKHDDNEKLEKKDGVLVRSIDKDKGK